MGGGGGGSALYLLDDPFNEGSTGRLPLLLVLLQNRLHMVLEQGGLQ